MASAIIGGLIQQGVPTSMVTVVEPFEAARSALRDNFGIEALPAANEALQRSECIVWAVKPQTFKEAAASAAPHTRQALHLSVAAGITTDSIAAWTGTGRIARAMPNTPALVGKGMTGLYARPEVDAGGKALIEQVIGTTGQFIWVDQEEQLDAVTDARILFLSPAESRVEVTLNDTLRHEFTVEGDASVRQIAVSAPHIHSLGFRVLAGTKDFIGYGAIFEGHGVVVDNYSVRSNNGQAMFWTNPSVNARIHSFAPYDLVILQYGLNIMQAGVTGYRGYASQIEKMVAYVRQCFPGAAVLILGVSDRSAKTDSGFEPMDAVPYMTESQRTAARNTGAAFWPTSDAMRAQGGMAVADVHQRQWPEDDEGAEARDGHADEAEREEQEHQNSALPGARG